MKYFKRMLLWISKTKHPNPSKEWFLVDSHYGLFPKYFFFKKKTANKNVVKPSPVSVTVKPKLKHSGRLMAATFSNPTPMDRTTGRSGRSRWVGGWLHSEVLVREGSGTLPETNGAGKPRNSYHFLRQLWLLSGVKLMEINSNWFSR